MLFKVILDQLKLPHYLKRSSIPGEQGRGGKLPEFAKYHRGFATQRHFIKRPYGLYLGVNLRVFCWSLVFVVE